MQAAVLLRLLRKAAVLLSLIRLRQRLVKLEPAMLPSVLRFLRVLALFLHRRLVVLLRLLLFLPLLPLLFRVNPATLFSLLSLQRLSC